MNGATEKRIKYLDIARTIAIICVVFNHAVNRSFPLYSGPYGSFKTIPLSQTLFEMVVAILSRLGVPLFLMITGALILNKKYDKDGIVRFYKHNWLPLLITTEIWLFIMYWILVFKDNGYSIRMVMANGPIVIIYLIKTMIFVQTYSMSSMWYMFMILCLYTVLPIVALVKDELPKVAKVIPITIVFISGIIIPSVNDILAITTDKALTFDLGAVNIFSVYLLYIIVGYSINKGIIAQVSNLIIYFIMLICLIGGMSIQLFACISEKNIVFGAGYHDLLIFAAAACLFEILRRNNEKIQGKLISCTYISKISFGINFVHICIMEVIKDMAPFINLYCSTLCCCLAIVSLIGSIVIIAVLSKVKVVGRYLFGIK